MRAILKLVTKKTLVLALMLLGVMLPTHSMAAPWQAAGTAACANFKCRVFFPQVAVNRRLDIQFASCWIQLTAATPDDVQPANLGVNDAFGNLSHVLVWDARSVAAGNSIYLAFSQPVILSINAGQRPQIGYAYATGNHAFIKCTLSGELVFL